MLRVVHRCTVISVNTQCRGIPGCALYREKRVSCGSAEGFLVKKLKAFLLPLLPDSPWARQDCDYTGDSDFKSLSRDGECHSLNF